MDSGLTRILDYIDGNMTDAESDAFSQDILHNEKLNKQYRYNLNVNTALTKLPTSKAPDAMMDNIMQSLTKPSFLTAKYSSFAGLKFIIAGAFVVTAILLLIGYLFSSDVAVAYNASQLTQYMDRIIPNWEMPTSSLMPYAPYVCFSLAIPLFAVLDNYMRSFSFINTK